MSGKLPLSIQMIRRLHNGLGIPARALIADVRGMGSREEPSEPDLDVQKFPLKEMSDRGLLPAIDGRGQKAQEHAAAEVKKFLARVAGLAKEPAFLRARLFQSGGRTMDDCALLVWRAAVVQKASRFPPKKAYVSGLINSAWLRKLAQKSKHENGPQLAREYLSAHGICLVVEERFKKTYLDGAAMMAAGAPIVALTLRHDRLDNFWFALLHEMVHIQKHLNWASPSFPDGLLSPLSLAQSRLG